MPCSGSFGGLFSVLILEAIAFHLPSDSHAQLKSDDEGCQGGLPPQFVLKIRYLQQGLLVL